MRWFLLLLFPTALLAEDLLLASWNIRIYSTGSRDDAELELIADRLQQIAIQEARDPEVVERTLAILESRGHTYEALVSEQVGRGVKERYAKTHPASISLPSKPGPLLTTVPLERCPPKTNSVAMEYLPTSMA